MSKLLILIRHGAAEHGGNSAMLHDIDRELISNGIIETARMGKYLEEKGYKADLIITSAANRAKDTAKIIAEQQHYLTENILVDDKIYGGGARSYLERLVQVAENVKTIIMIGHNPDISFFSEYITRPNFDDSMATTGVVIMSFDDNLKWAAISNKSGKFISYITPYSISHQE